MHLRSISLKGFKSFPDRTRLEFSPGVSVVVGPNGSGKSNITDAVLWALGEQSPLAVRGQSMQDVIFAGAHGVQARTEAEVEVVLDNGDGAVDLPAGEVSIARRLDRAGEGEYRVNGAKCRLVDVLEILSDTGLGKEMHSVVSQGRVEQIVTSKPRDRRLLIEEAAGLGKHRKRRRRAQLKLERTQDNLDRALDVEREARARLRPLKRQAEAAELHERLARQTDEARWTLAREDARVAREELAAAEAGGGRARKAEYEAIEAELTRLRAAREQAEAALAARGARARGAGQPRLRRALGGGADRAAARVRARSAVALIDDRTQRRRALLAGLEAETGEDEGDDDGARGARRGAGGRARAARPGPPRAPGAATSPSSRSAARRPSQACERLDAVADEAAGARAAPPTRPPTPPAAPAARSTPRPRRPAARPPRSAPSSPRSTSSCARTPARRAARRRWPTRCGPSRATSSRSPPRSARGCAPRWPPNFSEAAALLERAGRDGGAALVPAGDATAPGGFSSAGSPPPSPDAEPLLAHVVFEDDGAAPSLGARPARRRLGRRGLRRAPPRLPRRRRDPRRPRVVAATRELRQVPGGRRGPAAVRAQPPRRARRRHRARRPRRARRARRGGAARRRRSPPPTPRATTPTAPPARPRAPATRRARPCATPAG